MVERVESSPATAAPSRASSQERWPSRDSLGMPHRGTWMHQFVLMWGCWLVRGYYRMETRGEPFPEDEPVLLVQNHNNGLCDAHFLMSSTNRPIRILVKYTLMKVPLIGWMLRGMHAVPMYRKKDGVDTRKNAGAFEAIDQALQENTVVALFPEGESLNAIGLRELRSGVARMAVSAIDASDEDLGLLVVPLGVTYENRDRFRSRASSLIGPAIDVSEVLAPVGTDNARTASQVLMKEVRKQLENLIYHATSPEEHEAVCALERLMPCDDAPLGIRRQRAAQAIRRDTREGAAERHVLVGKLGTSLERGRLTGDDVLADRPGFLVTWGTFFALLPLLAVGLIAWCIPLIGALIFAKFRRTPDKKVTLHVLGGFAGFVLWIPILTLILCFGFGWWGLLFAAAIFAIGLKTFIPVVDRMLGLRGDIIRRALHRSPSEIESLRDAIRSIREAYPGAASGAAA